MKFAQFMSSPTGRGIRIVAGLALIVVGALLVFSFNNPITGIILVVVGLVPFLAGLMDICLFAPLFGAPFSGTKARAH